MGPLSTCSSAIASLISTIITARWIALALQGVFNPETKRPWNQQDADARWALIKREAASDVTTCALVASLPELQKKLQELQQQAAASQNGASPSKK